MYGSWATLSLFFHFGGTDVSTMSSHTLPITRWKFRLLASWPSVQKFAWRSCWRPSCFLYVSATTGHFPYVIFAFRVCQCFFMNFSPLGVPRIKSSTFQFFCRLFSIICPLWLHSLHRAVPTWQAIRLWTATNFYLDPLFSRVPFFGCWRHTAARCRSQYQSFYTPIVSTAASLLVISWCSATTSDFYQLASRSVVFISFKSVTLSASFSWFIASLCIGLHLFSIRCHHGYNLFHKWYCTVKWLHDYSSQSNDAQSNNLANPIQPLLMPVVMRIIEYTWGLDW
jgi:hypothetical protein